MNQDEVDPLRCPICSGEAERGCIYAADHSDLRWIAGEPSWKKNIKAAFLGGERVGEYAVPFYGAIARGIFCRSCKRVILDVRAPENHFPDVVEKKSKDESCE
ncbi:MAG: hypothetical protein JXB85_03900 [Anaerolineales bacterium]|nr:hypothetical protein [Anaerolineales bacterium]